MAVRAYKENVSLLTLQFLQELLRDYHPRNFEIELWDGTRWPAEAGQFRRFTWKINAPGILRAALGSDNQLALAEGYIYNDFDIEGDIESIFPLADYLSNLGAMRKLRLTALLRKLPSSPEKHSHEHAASLHGREHSKKRDRQAIHYHYDVSNDFYRLWLDPNMVYSCAYFHRATDNLAAAQVQKLDHICRKLRLKSGERLLDVGCGWGGLILHAVKNYGVHALGITLSEQQFALASKRIKQENLTDRCEVKLIDYRELNEPESFDKAASVGMVEHVGEHNLEEYFQCVYRQLKPEGVFLNHGIGVPENTIHSTEPTFADVYVFPDGELVPIGTMTRAAEHASFEVRDVENLREHYALTLHHWVQRMSEHSKDALQFVDEVTYRIWRLHMAGSAYYFQRGRLDLYQTLLSKTANGRSNLPLTRTDWYAAH